MRRGVALKHEFVEFIPKQLDDDVIYISIPYATAVHKCACGCGERVVTPLSPTDWQLIFDGKSISLYPSIGNWGFQCQSHYWIRSNKVEWARRWSRKEVDAGRRRDQSARDRYFADLPDVDHEYAAASTSGEAKPSGIWHRIKKRWFGRGH